MADTKRLHISKLDDFKEWLVKDGWTIDDPEDAGELLRARKDGRQIPIIIYSETDAEGYLNVMVWDSGVIGAYLRDSKRPKTNGDKIRAMTDEELADFVYSQVIAKCNNHDCVGADYCYYHADMNSSCGNGCEQAIVKWLKAEIK